jgi:hypothetical protein
MIEFSTVHRLTPPTEKTLARRALENIRNYYKDIQGYFPRRVSERRYKSS